MRITVQQDQTIMVLLQKVLAPEQQTSVYMQEVLVQQITMV